MTDQNAQKLRAVQAAVALLPEQGVIGLGTGSTADLFIEQVSRLVQQGRKLVGVPTSRRSETLARKLGVPLLDETGPWEIDICVDGADEVSANLDLIKGGGACHLREKIVNAHSRTNVIVVDASKLSQRLGERWAVPVEVAPFGHAATAQYLAKFGPVSPRMTRPTTADEPLTRLVTDSGNHIYDVKTGPIEAPTALDEAMRAIPGVVETGLFIGRTTKLIVAGPDYIREISRP
jgi:ribose 5-phosphate isomerase A